MKNIKNMLDGLIILLLTALGLPMVPLGLPMVPLLPTFRPMVTLAPLATNVSTNGNIGTIGYQERFRVLWLPMVPLATNGTIGKISNVTIARIPNARTNLLPFLTLFIQRRVANLYTKCFHLNGYRSKQCYRALTWKIWSWFDALRSYTLKYSTCCCAVGTGSLIFVLKKRYFLFCRSISRHSCGLITKRTEIKWPTLKCKYFRSLCVFAQSHANSKGI